jgi:hypothetical protein
MKPTLPLRTPSSKDASSETAPVRRLARADSAEQSTTPLSPSTARPQLLRSPLARVSSLAQEQDAAPDPSRTVSAAGDLAPSTLSPLAEYPGLTRAELSTPGDGTAKGKSPGPSPDEETLAKLRDAVSAKMLLQQRMRTSHDNKRPAMLRDNPEAARPLSTVSSSSAMTSTSTASTESAKTIRGSVPNTPAVGGQPLRTPSYPFPYVPGTPRTWSSSFHQPFTSLSPTVSSHFSADHNTPGADSSGLTSGGSTPAAAPAMFAPPGAQPPRPEDPRFPTPNLYDLVLQLSAEPGLDAWWAAVANIMHDHYKAERVTLAMPADPTDIENVPWGQKATFSMSGREEFVPGPTDKEAPPQGERPNFTLREPSGDALNDVRPQNSTPSDYDHVSTQDTPTLAKPVTYRIQFPSRLRQAIGHLACAAPSHMLLEHLSPQATHDCLPFVCLQLQVCGLALLRISILAATRTVSIPAHTQQCSLYFERSTMSLTRLLSLAALIAC